MKQKTLLLFQLLLAIFSIYSVLKYSGNQRMIVPLTCLVAMFLVGKVETAVSEREKKKKDQRVKAGKDIDEKTTFKPVDCLLKSKNVLLLTDAIHYLLNELGLKVSRSPDQSFIDRLIRTMDDGEITFGLKVLGDVGELSENWESWEEVTDFDMGKGGKRRVLLIGSNTTDEEADGKPKFSDFSANIQSLLSSKNIVAMTTLTFYKIYLLCQKKSVKPQAVLDLIHRHPGGVFRLEQYMKGSKQAA
ncbi:MAG: hypothetical protein LJE89_05500 [Deltaproteobacteria bacterium]|jgi:hypothetical protein|nr:hypothetical protein [Deltaproteobacteria bacterium]